MKKIRDASQTDVPFILRMIRELAAYERAPDAVIVTQEDLKRDGFSEHPKFQSYILEINLNPVGFFLIYDRYSTWKGKCLYLEDLYVIPEQRNQGLGKMVMDYLLEKAKNEGYRRFEWQVLDWNEPSIEFYKIFGATLDGGWINCRIEGDSLKK